MKEVMILSIPEVTAQALGFRLLIVSIINSGYNKCNFTIKRVISIEEGYS